MTQLSPIVLGIVGYRNFDRYFFIEQHIDHFLIEIGFSPKKHTLKAISGGCKGVDTCGQQWAARNKIPFHKYQPDFKKYPNGYQAYCERDKEIANNCTHLIAFPSHQGKGTQLTIKFAQEQDKVVKVIWVD